MSLDETQARWLNRFTAGAVKMPPPKIGPTNDPLEAVRDDLRARQAEERVKEQALKEAMLDKVFGVIDKRKEEIRKACDLIAKAKNEKGKAEEERFNDPRGQAKGFDASRVTTLEEVPEGAAPAQRQMGKIKPGEKPREKDNPLPGLPDDFFKRTGELDATSAYALIVEQKDYLAGKKVERSVIDEKAGIIVTQTQRLFDDDEIEKELYTPLARELVLPDTLINDLYSNTQKMIDGSNEYYINECKEKGKRPTTGALTFAKSAVDLGAAIATTVVAGLGPVKEGQTAMANSGTLSKEQATQATVITTGVAALLTTGIDIADQIDDAQRTGDFSVSGYKKVMNGIALGIGKIVAGSTGDSSLGLVITDGIVAGATATALIPTFVNWRLKGGDPPVGDIIESLGDIIGSSFSAKSDETSGDTSTQWAQAGAGVGAAFKTVAAASNAKLIDSFKKGDWEKVFSVLAAAGQSAAAAVPNMVRFAAEYNAIDGSDPTNPNQTQQEKDEAAFQQQQTLLKAMEGLATNVDTLGKAAEGLSLESGKAIAEKYGIKGVTPAQSEKQLKEMEAKFKTKQDALDAQAAEELRRDIANIQKQLDEERKAYQDSLSCLGSTEPKDAEYKSIAKLVAQIERDRAIWNGLFAIFGAGLAGAASVEAASTAAATVVPGLKIAGQLVKFVQNLKAAAERLSAFLDWKDARKDAESAVSPYATSIQNFVSNQGAQFTHYTIQATANIIQALLAAGELSPLAPAFTAATGAVAATAAAEDLVYKFIKQQALRTAWKDTKEALDPKNKGDRKMALLVREINPTLAKYTIAYGALIEKSPVAITAMNRIGLDRETLTRAGDKVGDVKNYLQTLYLDDNVVLGRLDAEPGKTKVPAPALTAKAWSVSYMVWSEKEGLATPNPPEIVANLTLVESLRAKKATDLKPDEQSQLFESLRTLENGFKSFDPRAKSTAELKTVQDKVEEYADLTYVAIKTAEMELAQAP